MVYRHRRPDEKMPPEPLAYRITQKVVIPYREVGSRRPSKWENEDISVQDQWTEIDLQIRAAIMAEGNETDN